MLLLIAGSVKVNGREPKHSLGLVFNVDIVMSVTAWQSKSMQTPIVENSAQGFILLAPICPWF
jgi:hypothetical protein